MRASAPALIATHLGAVAVGWIAADKEPVDTEVENTGFFQVDTTKVLATTVESLRTENRLLVFSYKGSAKVQAERKVWWLFGGRQELIVPAVVNYYVKLSELSLADVSFNETAKIVTVRLPKVTLGDIAFQPENATTTNGGILTWDDDQVEALRKLNYRNARRAMVAQAQQPGLRTAAERQAKENIGNLFEIPLRIAGQPDVKVIATF
jgi:hypothetical protein